MQGCWVSIFFQRAIGLTEVNELYFYIENLATIFFYKEDNSKFLFLEINLKVKDDIVARVFNRNSKT